LSKNLSENLSKNLSKNSNKNLNKKSTRGDEPAALAVVDYVKLSTTLQQGK